MAASRNGAGDSSSVLNIIYEAHSVLQHGFESSDVDVALTFDHANADEMDVNRLANPAVLLNTFLTSASLLESSNDSNLLAKSLLLDSDPPPGRTLQADISCTPDIKAPNSQNDLSFSHMLSSNLRSFSTRDHTSDILSRSTLNGEKGDLKTESELTISAGCGSEDLPAPVLDALISPAECCEPVPLTDTDYLTIGSSSVVPSFTPGGQSEASHEEMAAFVIDIHPELLQSGPRITSVTNFGAHTQGLPSSSPLSSSPPMNLNFPPSSSPIPSSSPPLNEMGRTPPTSPFAATDAYERGMTSAGQEVTQVIEYICMLNRHFRSSTPLEYTLYIPNHSSIMTTTLKVRYNIVFLGQHRN